VHGVTVGRGLRRDLGADHPVGAGAIVHYDLLLESLIQLGLQDPRDEIGRAARREAHDDAQRLGGEVLSSRGNASHDRRQSRNASQYYEMQAHHPSRELNKPTVHQAPSILDMSRHAVPTGL
jgi:hypothetical protein